VKHLRTLRDLIQDLVDWIYIPFRKIIPAQTFRYAVCGGTNTSLDIFLYFICYNFVLKKQDLDIIVIKITPHIASFLIVFPITFVTGFILSKYITFPESQIRRRIQFFRYGLTVTGAITLNYVFLKLFVEHVGLYPTPSKMITALIVILYSYYSNKYYTFKHRKLEANYVDS
jgi:putative flippase GtrA